MAVKKKVKPLGILIILFLLASVCLIVMGGSVIYLGSPVDKNNKDNIEVEIKSGTSSTAIGKLLKEKDLIKRYKACLVQHVFFFWVVSCMKRPSGCSLQRQLLNRALNCNLSGSSPRTLYIK